MSIRTIQPGRWTLAHSFFVHLTDLLASLLSARHERPDDATAMCHQCGALAWMLDFFKAPQCERRARL